MTVKRNHLVQDNLVAELIIGPVNANIHYIEDRLGVEIKAERPEFTIFAPNKQAADTALSLLGYLEEEVGNAVKQGKQDDHPLHIEGLIDFYLSSDKQDTKAAQITTRKQTIIARSGTQADYLKAMESSDLTFGLGPAGTGKTFLAVAMAVSMLERKEIERIILCRPAVEAGERLGFLPGDMKEKIDPYLSPLYDALQTVVYADKLHKYYEQGVIEIAPLAFMRGRTLGSAFVIMDEAQNSTSQQMKMFLTRMGRRSRMVVNGDPSQIDLPEKQISGLCEAETILKKVEGVSFIRFNTSDIVRHPLVGRIINAYDAHSAKK